MRSLSARHKSRMPRRHGSLFGKPVDQVIKHPGAFRAQAKAAGMSTAAFAQAHKGDSGVTGRRARLAITLMRMGKKRRK